MIGNCQKGAASELIAVAWLLNQGYEVFRNVCPVGKTDIIAVRVNQFIKIDVKTATLEPNGTFNIRKIQKEALDQGVKYLFVDPEKYKVLGWSDEVSNLNCEICGKEAKSTRGTRWSVCCSDECRIKHRSVYMKTYNQKKNVSKP